MHSNNGQRDHRASKKRIRQIRREINRHNDCFNISRHEDSLELSHDNDWSHRQPKQRLKDPKMGRHSQGCFSTASITDLRYLRLLPDKVRQVWT